MKRVGYITDKDGRRITLLEAMGDYGNVQKAYNKARKCKRHRKDVLIFTKDKEENLDKVREDIINTRSYPFLSPCQYSVELCACNVFTKSHAPRPPTFVLTFHG